MVAHRQQGAAGPIWIFPISVGARSIWAGVGLSGQVSGGIVLSPRANVEASNASNAASHAAFFLLLEHIGRYQFELCK